MKNIVSFIVQNKILTVFSLGVIGIVCVLLFSLLQERSTPSPQQKLLPTPTRVPQQLSPTPDPSVLETVPQGSKPWLAFLPFKNPYYYADYDPLSKTIQVKLYPFNSPSITKEEQVEELKKRVEEKLIKIGVNLQEETVEYTVEN